ncbi:MAG: NUDIX domain-containing protein [Candidatus Micrarchaeota archaeon]|nr:NUDIX domain-containing protein [Candidatus Micrarchaeota archaeon]
MELLAEISEETFGKKAPKNVRYKVRRAARAVIFNKENKIALMYASKYGYYKLPGGGIEERESIEHALKREAMEEVGARIKIGRPVGIINEYRGKFKTFQISYCFVCKLVSKKLSKPKPTLEEIGEGFEVKWVTPKQAIRLVKDSETEYLDSQFITFRDQRFINEAMKG